MNMTSNAPVWFITAASSGFGHDIAVEALKRGHTVVATARSLSRIQDLADAGAQTLAFDVTAPSDYMEKVAKEVFDKYGRVDYLINAAGFILEGAVEEVSSKELFDCFNTNVFGTVATIKAFLPGIRSQSKRSNGSRATIATFGSLGSWEGGASYAIYAMTKACASSLAESLKEELEPFDIQATVIEPGYFRTGFLNPGARVNAQTRMDAYEDEGTPTGKVRKTLGFVDGNQPGDVKKGCRVIVDALTRTGLAERKALPLRLVLGSDCERVIRSKVSSTVELLDEWKDIARSTDY